MLNEVSGLKNLVPSIGKKVLNELIDLWLNSCNDMEFLIDITRDQGSTVAFSNLVELDIYDMNSLKGLCYGLSPSHRAIASFTRLKVVKITSCPKLKTIFSPCLAQSMLCIEELYIRHCNGVEQVIGFPQEEEITKNDSRLCYCPKLRILEIYGCRSLKYVCSNISTQELQSLESIKIRDCPQLMQIFKMKQNENGQGVVVPQIHCWPKLRTFWISDCQLFSCFIVQAPLLEDLFLNNVGIIWKTDVPLLNEDCIVIGNHEKVFQVQGRYSFSRIEELDLRNLFEIRIIWNDFAQAVTLENLTTLILRDCKKLRYIFSPTTARSLSHLTNITVTNCENLKSLFPFGSIPVLPKLERLKVKRNSKLEQVFELEDELEVVAEEEMKFDKLKKLSLKELPSLIHFGPKGYHSVLSALEDLKVRDCPKLTTSFSIDPHEFVHCETKESMANLISLQLGSFPELSCIWNGLNHCINLHYLEIIKITGCGKLTYLFSEFTSRTLEHLKLLYIRNCFSLEHLIEEVENMDEIDVSIFWPKLKTVDIRKCKNLKYLCSSTLAKGLPNLESIKIEDCPRLLQVFNVEKNKDGFGLQNHLWPALRTLRIVNCQILKYVFTNTLSHGFPSLRSVYLKNCPQLQVFSPTEERDVIGDHILLNVPCLRNLSVSNCPQFSCFIVQAQLMEVLVLNNMGNSRQLLNVDLPVLNEDCIVVGNQEEVFQVQGGCSFSWIKKLYLKNLFEVQILWKDFAQVVNLKNLTTLKLRGCKKLRYIFSPTTAFSLSRLVDLFIEGCEKIEQLILAEDQVSSSSSNGDTGLQPISFPKLTKITITKCENLKSLFPFGSVPVLPRLESLIVKRNSKLEQVFKLEDEVEVEAEEEMKFDKLEWLTLEELPSLIHFCPEGCHFVLPALIELKVSDCPKLTIGFFIDSQEFMHCKTKTHQLVEEDVIEESATVSNAIFNKNICWSRRGFSESQLPHIT
ncbi:hypothetical protein PVK06_018237 [Gossypium arboreum]|uniref:Disease resistance protein At4g27190-like leucine-rich repeats domain-containing protein n=1 Tax=Gossypium arboreum TaxID=29729 RepID=A0ABR0Q4X2_GOSAR|nr:hypothetical protein PVK06_018237 [Gossypium arboreum]